MKLAIIHFHLNRGGVTSVILNHLRAIEAVGSEFIEEVILLHGGRTAGLPEKLPELPIRLLEISELEYDSVRETPADRLSETFERRLRESGCRPEDTVLHVHNHSLGKNVEFLSAIRRLAEQGWRWVLQIHDFAEDFRPENYRQLLLSAGEGDVDLLAQRLYPQASQIHYVVLNGRDRAILAKAGVAEERLHLLPNPVFPFEKLPAQQSARENLQQVRQIDTGKRLLVYPVRGIRRKNLGEMLFWSALGQGHLICATTLPPQNPIEKTSYDFWKNLSQELKLPCEWELGTESELAFVDILAAADAILTTSLAEGFGMVFLEAWLAGKPLFGRDLPEITLDFKQVGVWYPDLSSSLLIPVECLDLNAVRVSFLSSYRETLKQFAAPIPAGKSLDEQFESLIARDAVDFAILDRSQQAEVIANVASNPVLADRVLALNPICKSLLKEDLNQQAALIRANSETILSEFSLASTGKRLQGIYNSLLEVETDSVKPLEHPQAVRDEFLQVVRFHPARVNP